MMPSCDGSAPEMLRGGGENLSLFRWLFTVIRRGCIVHRALFLAACMQSCGVVTDARWKAEWCCDDAQYAAVRSLQPCMPIHPDDLTPLRLPIISAAE